MGNKKKSEQLGMPHGTACGKLRKKILFDLLERLGQDRCYHCGQAIGGPDNLSIEHKIPWMDSDDPPALFWDLDNVTFSHTRCNYGSRRNTPARTGHVPWNKQLVAPGFKWCSRCGEEPKANFSKNASMPDGLESYCKRCRKVIR